MSTTTPTPPSSSPAVSKPSTLTRSDLIRNLSIGAVVICPIIIALPPRKLDIYTLLLTGGFFAGGNQVVHEYTGQSLVQRFGSRMQSMTGRTLPPKAVEMQRRLREEKAARNNANAPQAMTGGVFGKVGEGLEGKKVGEDGKVLEEVKRRQEEEEIKKRGILEKVWMGNEGKDWKQKRDQNEKEAMEDGRGYGGLIKEQIWEVWNWGRDKVEEVKEVDEKVVEARKEVIDKEKGKK